MKSGHRAEHSLSTGQARGQPIHPSPLPVVEGGGRELSLVDC